MKPFEIGEAEVGGKALLVVAGPCVVESADLCLEVAAHLRTLCAARGMPFVFKASYKKANRSSGLSFKGLGDDLALAALAKVKSDLGVPILTDVHETSDCAPAAEVANVLQIPAFLCRQTELLEAAAATGRVINVKKGQFLPPADMANAIAKIQAAGGQRVMLTERGSMFGYGDLVVDMRGLVVMRDLGWPVLYDATHSLQRPGGTQTGGDRRFAFPLMRAALACGVDGLFFEAHPDPEHAKSDAATQLPLAEAERFLDQALRAHEAAHA